MSLDASTIRSDFPILDQQIGEHPLIYLDNGATTHTPREVYEVFEDFYSRYNSNIHRGMHTLSHRASVAYEEAHDTLAAFIGASGGRKEMVFTKNATESVNLVANGFGLNELGPGDEIVTTVMEHHAMLVTWQQVAKKTGATINYIQTTEDDRLDLEHAKELIGEDTAIVAVSHVSNVLGTINPVEKLADMAHEYDAKILVDGAQSVPTRPIDVEAMDIDFLAFSGHKMLGPTGIGCLYGKEQLLEEMEPFLFGGEMIQHVTLKDSSWNELPWKFEAGTPPISAGIALAVAAEYLADIGMDTVRQHENELAQYAIDQLSKRDNIEIYGPPAGVERSGLVAFNIDDVHGHDVSSLLNDKGIAVRAGNHCTQPLHNQLDISGSVRASFYIYNTKAEIDRLIEVLEQAPDALPGYLSSDRYHESIFDHYQHPNNADGIEDPTFTKSSEETTCGDEGEFQVRVASDGTIEEIAFESDSCAVSRSVASMLTVYLQGKSMSEVAELEGVVSELLDHTYPDLRHECVVGPETVIREGAKQYLEEQ